MIQQINLEVLILIMFIHWVADFLFQTKERAINKSKSNYYLFQHVLVYTLTFYVFGLTFYSSISAIAFCGITFLFHFITDYFTSRWTSRLYRNKKFYGFPSFFSVIGLDQFLHFVQLILTYAWVTSLNS